MRCNAIKVLLVGVFLLVASTSSVLAAGPYVGFAGGVSIFHENDVKVSGFPTVQASYDTGYGFIANAGYAFDGPRLEAEFGYKASTMKALSFNGNSVTLPDNDIYVMSFMGNAYYDIKNTSAFTPYIGAGIGLVKGEFKANGSSDEFNVFGYQMMIGGAYKLNKNISLDLSYRFQGSSDFSKDGTSISYMSSNIFAGIRNSF